MVHMIDLNEIQPTVAKDEASKPNPLFNRSAIKRFAKQISTETRGSKFNRVSGEFIDLVEARLETKLRELEAVVTSVIGTKVVCKDQFLTKAGKARVLAAFNAHVAGTTHSETKKVRMGKTF